MKKILIITLTFLLTYSATLNIFSYASETNPDASYSDIVIEKNLNEPNLLPEYNEIPLLENDIIPEGITTTSIDNIESKDEFNLSEPLKEYTPVENIELSDFKEEMYVSEVQYLSVNILPVTATQQNVYYSSSNSSVATINSTGKLTAVGKGTCQIKLSCDNIDVSYSLKVKVKTEIINVKSNYIVLKPNETYNLEASVHPYDASQSLNFKSQNESIAIVDPHGMITAKAAGSTAIIVSNIDTSTLINVIVNKNSDSIASPNTDKINNDYLKSDIDEIARQIKKSTNNEIVVKGINKISSSALKELYGTDKTLIVELENYDISINGRDVLNANNEINTLLDLANTQNGLILNITNEQKLPGTIKITLKDKSSKFRYLYQVNEKSNNYQMINSINNNRFQINSVGKYLLSYKKLNHIKINIIWILSGIGIFLLISIIYIFTKKKYWLW